MIDALAGIWAPPDVLPPDGAEEIVRRGLAGAGPLRLVRGGGLCAAVAGGSVHEAGGSGCIALGTLSELDGPAGQDAATRLLDGHRRDGDAALRRLRGDFAIVLWDPREALVARSQLAGRPLYWHSWGDRLLFASEIDALLRMLPARPAPDDAAVAHWLAMSGMPGDRTLFEGVRRLPSGHVLRLAHGRAPRIEPYWRPRYEPPLRMPRAEIVASLRDALIRSVGRCSTGSSTAVMLSGGLDSSSIAAFAMHGLDESDRPRRAYSAIFPSHPETDESEFIDGTARALGLDSVRLEVAGGSVLAGALAYTARWGVPPMSPNLFFWIPLLERAAQDGTRVLLDGEGGDEVFALSPYLLADRVRRGRLASALRLARRTPGAGDPRPWRSSGRVLRRYGFRGAAPAWVHVLARRARGPEHYLPGWLRSGAAQAYFRDHDPTRWKRADGPRWWAWHVEQIVHGYGPTLGYEHIRRRGGMAGIEPRHPIADLDLVELILRVPPELSFDARWTRPLLREAGEGIVPEPVRTRSRKSSFDAVFHDALAGPDLPAVRRLLGDPAAEIGRWVRRDAFREEFLDAPPPAGGPARQAWAMFVWRALTAECWLRSQHDPGFPERLVEQENLARGHVVFAPVVP